jgi:hypothetical protein
MVEHHGEAYWLREHQIPSVLVCPEHGTVLRFADMSGAGKRGYCAATDESCPAEAQLLVDDPTDAELRTLGEIAVRSKALLLGERNLLSRQMRREEYQAALVAKGLSFGAEQTDSFKLRRAVAEHFGHMKRIWPDIFANIASGASETIDRIPINRAKGTDPLIHILIAMTLERMPDKRPAFGRGPWPCPNSLAAHDSELPVTRLELSGTACDRVYGKFYCPCRYVFVRAEKQNGDLTPPIVRAFGESLRPLLNRAVVERWGISRAAKAAGIGEEALIKQARALGFTAPWKKEGTNMPTRKVRK